MVNSPAADPRFSDAIDCITGYRTEAILTVPMRGADGRIIGACQALNKSGGFAPATSTCSRLRRASPRRPSRTNNCSANARMRSV